MGLPVTLMQLVAGIGSIPNQYNLGSSGHRRICKKQGQAVGLRLGMGRERKSWSLEEDQMTQFLCIYSKGSKIGTLLFHFAGDNCHCPADDRGRVNAESHVCSICRFQQ